MLIPVLSTCLPLMDEFCRRFVRFMNCCVNNDSKLVRDISMNAILFSKMKSGLGRNVVFCCLRYGIPRSDVFWLSPEDVGHRVNYEMTDMDFYKVEFLLELIFVRERFFSVDGDWSSKDIDCIIEDICTGSLN